MILCGLVVSACGSDGGSGPDAAPATCASGGGARCFQLPTAPLIGHSAAGSGAATIGCGPIVPVHAATAVTVSGTTKNYSGAAPVPAAAIAIYDRDDYATPIATTTSAGNGTYSIVVPAGTPDLLFGSASANGFVAMHYANLRPDLSQPTLTDYTVWLSTQELLDTDFTLVDATWDHAKASLAVAVSDCDRRAIEHAAVTVSSTSGQRAFVPGVSVFYSAAGAFPFPVRPEARGDTNDNGSAAVANVPVAGPAYLQVWGFPSAAALAQGEAGLVLVAEYPLTRSAGGAIAFVAWANR